MIYELPPHEARIDQGDIIADCPVQHIARFDERITWGDVTSLDIDTDLCRVIVLTQTCDLANAKTTTALVARVHDAAELLRHGLLKTADIRGPIRSGRVFGWYFLPANPGRALPESLLDLHQLHTIRLDLLGALNLAGKRICRLTTPYREHLAQHFATTYARIGLPEPYETQAD
jgi:hypothetical protein